MSSATETERLHTATTSLPGESRGPAANQSSALQPEERCQLIGHPGSPDGFVLVFFSFNCVSFCSEFHFNHLEILQMTQQFCYI